MSADFDDLVERGRRATRPFLEPRLCLREDLLVSSAEAYLTRDRPKAPEIPPPLEDAPVLAPQPRPVPESFLRLLRRLDELELDEAQLIDFLSEEDAQTALHWFFALGLLTEPQSDGVAVPDVPWELVPGPGGIQLRSKGSVALMTDIRLRRRKQHA